MLLQPSQSSVYRKEKLKFFGLEARYLKRRHAIADFFLPFQVIWQGLPELSMPSLPLQRNANRFEDVENKAKMTIGIVPGVGAKRGNRSWPLDYYEQLVKTLLEDESGMGPLRIQLFGGPDEVSLCQHLQQRGVKHLNSGQLENHCAQYSILETAQAMTGCDVLLAGDTGPLHLASASGIEVIGLFGPTSPNRTGPRGLGVCESLTPEGTLTCWPCEKPVCPLSGEMTDACMKSISPERVLIQLKEIQERLIAQRQSG
jgi:ADP-heptose:LPS heptosyltransferase